MTIVQKLLHETQENESPKQFLYWSMLSTIGTIARKNVWTNRHSYKMYPNLYVFLIAKSGLRKGFPVTVAKSLIETVNNTRVIVGRNSIQSVIKEMAAPLRLENGTMLKQAYGILLSGEIAAFLLRDPDAFTLLTDLYDTWAHEKEWKNSLKQGIEKLASPCLSLLGATNEDHFIDAVPLTAIKGGFIGRTLLVYADKKRTLNSLMYAPAHTVNFEEIVTHLKEVAKLEGEFRWTDRAKYLYNAWYNKFAVLDHSDQTGTAERLHENVVKVSMCLALAEAPELVVHERHVDEAISSCLDCLASTQRVITGTGKATLARQTKMLMESLFVAPGHQLNRQVILRRFWGDFDSFDLDRMIASMEAAGAIKVTQNGKNNMTYELTKETIELYAKINRQTSRYQD